MFKKQQEQTVIVNLLVQQNTLLEAILKELQQKKTPEVVQVSNETTVDTSGKKFVKTDSRKEVTSKTADRAFHATYNLGNGKYITLIGYGPNNENYRESVFLKYIKKNNEDIYKNFDRRKLRTRSITLVQISELILNPNYDVDYDKSFRIYKVPRDNKDAFYIVEKDFKEKYPRRKLVHKAHHNKNK